MSALKAVIGRNITRLITSEMLQGVMRSVNAIPRRLGMRAATVHFFYQHDDPYSQLLARYLPALQARYRIALKVHPVPPPDAAAAPDLERLTRWSERDAARLSATLPEPLPRSVALPLPESVDAATGARNAALRARWGHYLGATLYFEGEWYWGTDRLHYLEQRLQQAGLLLQSPERKPAPLVEPGKPRWHQVPIRPAKKKLQIHFFCSLRSPYTYLAAAQVRQLADHYGAELKLRFVLPMVMRGLPVPLTKRLYILRDSKREATRLGLPFGRVVDPVGKPVENGLALLQAAILRGRGPQFLEAFLQGVFAQGLDAGDTRNLTQIFH